MYIFLNTRQEHIKKIYILLIWIAMLSLSSNLYAKRPNISDSLAKALEKTQQDSIRVNILIELSHEYLDKNIDSAQIFCTKALDIAKKINYYKGEAESLQMLGTVYYYKGEFVQALDVLENSLKLFKTQKNCEHFIVQVLQTIGVINSILGNNAEALGYFFKIVDIYSASGDSIGLANTLSNIGIVYDKERKYNQAIEYYKKSIEIRGKIGDNAKMSIALNNIGIIYSKLEEYEKALKYFYTSLKNSQSIDDERTLAITLGNIGNVYEKLNDLPKALNFQYQALEIKRKYANYKGIAHTMHSIGEVKYRMGLFNESMDSFMEALENALQASDKYLIRDTYKAIYKTYGETEVYDSALKYAKLYFKLNAELNNELSNRNITSIQSKFENENREREIKLLQQEKEARDIRLKKTNTIIWSVSIAFIIAFGLLLFILRSYKQRLNLNKSLHTRKEEIEHQKEEILHQRNNLENLYLELNHRKEEIQTQHDIIDKKNQYITDSINYAKFIQEALLPQSIQLQKYISEAFVFFEPKDILSGDFYWIAEKNGAIYLAVIDSSGHGIPGAFISIIGNNLLNKGLHEKQLDEPQHFLDYLNDGLYKTLKEHYNEFVVDSGMDIGILKLDLTKKELVFTGAHNPIYIIRQEELIQLKSSYFPLGLTLEEDSPKYQVEQQAVKLFEGDKMYLFSDGYVDQFGGGSGKKFMHKRLRQMLLEIHHLPTNVQKNHVEHVFKEWRGENEQVDDVLFMGINIS